MVLYSSRFTTDLYPDPPKLSSLSPGPLSPLWSRFSGFALVRSRFCPSILFRKVRVLCRNISMSEPSNLVTFESPYKSTSVSPMYPVQTTPLPDSGLAVLSVRVSTPNTTVRGAEVKYGKIQDLSTGVPDGVGPRGRDTEDQLKSVTLRGRLLDFYPPLSPWRSLERSGVTPPIQGDRYRRVEDRLLGRGRRCRKWSEVIVDGGPGKSGSPQRPVARTDLTR